MQQLENYIAGQWVKGAGKGTELFNAITGEAIYLADASGLDFDLMLNYGRNTGGPTLRKMTFQERGNMLKALAFHLLAKKDLFYQISAATGATKIDSWIDI